VVEVVDGETVVVSYGSHFATVRLYTVAAPKKDHPLAEVIRQHLADFVLGRMVSIRYSGMESDVINGLVFVNGNDIGLQMVRDGAASYNSKHERELSEITRQLYIESERAARNEKLGIWRTDLPVSSTLTQGEAGDNSTRPTRPSSVPVEPREPREYASSREGAASLNNAVPTQTTVPSASQGTKSIIWSRGAVGCDDLFSEGRYFRIIQGEGIEIVLTMYIGNDYRVADVFISNLSDKRKLIDPSTTRFTLADSGKPMVSLSPIGTEKIASQIKKRAKWANVFSAIASSVPQSSTSQSTTSGTVSAYGNNGSYANGTYQGTTTTTRMSPNVYAQKRAAENNRRRSSEAADRADQLQETALKINTLFPGEHTGGLIYFEKKKFVETGAFQILIDGTVYQFLFTPVAKR
jgi:endonuclease YncB( thermonuclease family)